MYRYRYMYMLEIRLQLCMDTVPTWTLIIECIILIISLSRTILMSYHGSSFTDRRVGRAVRPHSGVGWRVGEGLSRIVGLIEEGPASGASPRQRTHGGHRHAGRLIARRWLSWRYRTTPILTIFTQSVFLCFTLAFTRRMYYKFAITIFNFASRRINHKY